MRTSIVTASLTLCACGSGTGTIHVNTWGEEYIEQEIPSSEVEDGWTIRYSKFLVALGPIVVADAEGTEGARLAEQRIFDLSKAGPHAVTSFAEIEAKRWDDVQITNGPASGAVAGNAEAADVMAMNQGGYSSWVEGQILTGTVSKSFQWGFNTNTAFAECEEDGGSLGVVVPSGGAIDVQFTIHGDHFFYDGLQNPDAKVRADAIVAADADNDGTITQAELAAVDLTTLPTGQYTTGGSAAINDLGAFVAALSRTLVHFQGEGECVIR